LESQTWQKIVSSPDPQLGGSNWGSGNETRQKNAAALLGPIQSLLLQSVLGPIQSLLLQSVLPSHQSTVSRF